MLCRLFIIVSITITFAFGAETQKGIQAFIAKDYSNALSVFTENAKAGDPVAHAYLGWMYRNGLGVQKNSNEALKHYLSAAKQGENKAIRQLASMHMGGDGALKNYVIAYALGALLVNKGAVEEGRSFQGVIMPLMYKEDIQEAEQIAKTPEKLWSLIESEIK